MIAMQVLIEKGITDIDFRSIQESFQTAGIEPKIMQITFNREKIILPELEEHFQKQFKGKNLIITTRKIAGKPQMGLAFDYHGIASELGGSLAIVTYSENTKTKIGLISLHEALHLLGLKHCKTHGCIMGFKLCGFDLRYCLNCPHPCVSTHLCNECKRGLNGTSA
jgi:hypothetical protein